MNTINQRIQNNKTLNIFRNAAYYHDAAPDIEMGSKDKTDVMSPEHISLESCNIVTGDCVLVKREPYAGFYAVVLARSYGDELEIQYFEKKQGLPYRNYWVIKENDLDSREAADLEKVKPKIDNRNRYLFY